MIPELKIIVELGKYVPVLVLTNLKKINFVNLYVSLFSINSVGTYTRIIRTDFCLLKVTY